MASVSPKVHDAPGRRCLPCPVVDGEQSPCGSRSISRGSSFVTTASALSKAEVWEKVKYAQRGIAAQDQEIDRLKESIAACADLMVDRDKAIAQLQELLAEKTEQLARLQAQQSAGLEPHLCEVTGQMIPGAREFSTRPGRPTWATAAETGQPGTPGSSGPSGGGALGAGVAVHRADAATGAASLDSRSLSPAVEVKDLEQSAAGHECRRGHEDAARLLVTSVAIRGMSQCAKPGSRRFHVAFCIEPRFDSAGSGISLTDCGVWRRYSEFRALRDRMGRGLQARFPRKQPLSSMVCGLSVKQLEKRRGGLEAWLSNVVLDAQRGLLPEGLLRELCTFLRP